MLLLGGGLVASRRCHGVARVASCRLQLAQPRLRLGQLAPRVRQLLRNVSHQAGARQAAVGRQRRLVGAAAVGAGPVGCVSVGDSVPLPAGLRMWEEARASLVQGRVGERRVSISAGLHVAAAARAATHQKAASRAHWTASRGVAASTWAGGREGREEASAVAAALPIAAGSQARRHAGLWTAQKRSWTETETARCSCLPSPPLATHRALDLAVVHQHIPNHVSVRPLRHVQHAAAGGAGAGAAAWQQVGYWAPALRARPAAHASKTGQHEPVQRQQNPTPVPSAPTHATRRTAGR